MKHSMKCIVSLSITLIMTAVFSISAFAADATPRIVRVAFPQQTDLTEIRADGSYNGYTYDYLEKIAQLTGWKMEYISINEATLNESLLKALEMVQSGEVDLLGGLVKSPELMEQFEYTQNSYGIMYSVLTAHEEDLSVNYSNFMLKSPLRVGFWGSGEQTKKKLTDFFEDQSIDFEFVQYPNYNKMLSAFQNGDVDVIPDSSMSSIKGTRQLVIYTSEFFYFGAIKGNTALVSELDAAIDRLNLVFPYFQVDLAEKHTNSTQGDFFITDEEIAYAKEKKTIRALCVPDCAPFVFQNDAGEWRGIAVSIMEDFAAQNGLTLEYTTFDRSIDFMQAFKNGEYDCVLGIPINTAYNKQAGIITSTPYLQTQQVYFSKHNAVQKPMNESTIALISGSSLAETISCKNIVFYDTTEQCINAVMTGKVDGSYGNQYCVEYYSQHNFTPLTIVPLVGEKGVMEISVNKEADPALLSMLNRYLDNLDSAQIYSYHVAANAEHVNSWFRVLLYSDPVNSSLLLATVIFCICFGIAMFFFAKSSQKKNRQLQIASEAKSDFLSRVSHDMRTPMNAILSFSSMNLDKHTSPEQLAADMGQIHRAGQYLLGLINDVLDMSKIENERMELNLQPTLPSECLKAILATVQPLMDEKKLRFDIQMDLPDIEPILLLDVMRTKQLCINLLSNAAKFTPQGGSAIFRISVKKVTEQYVVMEFLIKDTGIGMSDEFQKHLFEPFSQEHRESTGQLMGTGLGLAIVKQLVDLMGGTISVQSNLNQGTEFIVELRHEIVHSAHPELISALPHNENGMDVLHGKRILLCEDHPINAEIAKRLLVKKGIEVEHMVNGQLGVEQFSASAEGYYNLVLMDIKMPVMDGLAATREIRALPRNDAKTVPIIAVTANAFDEDIEKSYNAGMNAHLSKPIEPTQLYQILSEFLR